MKLTVEKALKIMHFNDIRQVNKKSLSSRFREMAKLNHPDLQQKSKNKNCESEMKDINEAYHILKKIIAEEEKLNNLKRLSEQTEYTVIISLDQLIKVYCGEEIRTQDSTGLNTVLINNKNLRYHKVYILCEYRIQYKNGEETHDYDFTSTSRYNIKDDYTFECKVPVDLVSGAEITVNMYGKTMNLKLKTALTRLRFKFENGIYITLDIKAFQKERG